MGLHGHRHRFNFPIAQRKEPSVDVLSKDFYHQDGTHLLGGPLLLWLLRFIPPHTGFISGTSACESSAAASDRIHSSSSLKTVVTHQLRVEQEAAMFGEVARGPPQTKNIQHSEHAPPLPAPAMATMASRCSCRSPGGPGALTGASLMCGSEEKPVLLRASLRMSRVTCLCCFPSSCALPGSFPFLWSGWSAPDCEERVRLFKASCFQRSRKLLLPVSPSFLC